MPTNLKLVHTAIFDVQVLESPIHEDDRGFFVETWSAASFRDAGLDIAFVQDNHSRSAKGVLRGLHYQIVQPQGKLVRVMSGRAFVVTVDLRKSSATFGKHVTTELSDQNKLLLWVPPGFAHGFLSLEDGTDVLYKCTDFYAPQHERSLLWNDPAIGIVWPLNGKLPRMSAKDQAGVLLAQAETYP